MRPSLLAYAWIAAAGMLVFGLLGCGSDGDAAGENGDAAGANGGPDRTSGDAGNGERDRQSEADEGGATDGSSGGEIEVRYMSLEELQELLEDNRGKVVVLDVWNTACLPCIRELPHLVELQERYGPERIACITLNTDYYGAANRPPEFFEEDVLAVLRERQITVVNVISETEVDAVLEWLDAGTVPIVRVYDAEGSFRQFPEGDDMEVSYQENVFPHVAELLGE